MEEKSCRKESPSFVYRDSKDHKAQEDRLPNTSVIFRNKTNDYFEKAEQKINKRQESSYDTSLLKAGHSEILKKGMGLNYC
jgi:hypothetical protein